MTSSGAAASQKTGGQREQLTSEELAIVLSRFEIGGIEGVQEYARGSRKAPKLLISSEQGRFLLKRRARGRDDPFKVAFTHAIQLHLANKQFPLPHLIGTKKDNNSMFQWRGAVYELFEFIPGQGYPHTLEATFDGGRTLGLFHKLLIDFQSEYQPPSGSYHAAQVIEQALEIVRKNQFAAVPELRELANFMTDAYHAAGAMVEKQGLSTWPKRICHADWHPGNTLYRENRVVAVIDYDSARLLPQVVDIANGALQFSVIYGDDDVANWPDHPDQARFRRFLRGYEEVTVLSEVEIQVIPWLMIEALIAEAILPVATTGQFGKVDGAAFLKMVQRKVRWMQAHVDKLLEMAAG